MKLLPAVSVSFALVATVGACSSDTTDNGGTAGSAGHAAGASAVGGAGSGSGGSNAAGSGATGGNAAAGSAGSPASSAGSAGSATDGGSAGSGGSGGTSVGGASGGGGAAGASGSGGAGFWGPTGPKKQWSCPPGPFGAQTRSAATQICTDFKYNYNYNEGPTWIASQNAFFFSNFIHSSNLGGDIVKYTIGGQCEVWVHDVGCNGLGVSPSGNLLAACQGTRAVMEFDMLTKKGRVVASMANGKMLDSPNDLIARSDGNVYFSNTTFEIGTGNKIGLNAALVRIDPLGVVSVIEAGGLNGVALSPDEKKLYVVGKGVYPLDDKGVPGARDNNDPGGDGIAVDCAGKITNDPTNSAYGGPDGKTLIVVGGEQPGLFAKTYQVSVPGLP
jgi:gluconolactonase